MIKGLAFSEHGAKCFNIQFKWNTASMPRARNAWPPCSICVCSLDLWGDALTNPILYWKGPKSCDWPNTTCLVNGGERIQTRGSDSGNCAPRHGPQPLLPHRPSPAPDLRTPVQGLGMHWNQRHLPSSQDCGAALEDVGCRTPRIEPGP